MDTVPKPTPVLKGLGQIPSNFQKSGRKISSSSTSASFSFNWNVLNEDIALPAAVLDSKSIDHNIAWMQAFADHYGVKLCPHGKTTMCPHLFHRQLKAGAWGISLASATQVQVAHSFGIPRILMVNQLVGKTNMAIIANIQSVDPKFEVACLVESAANVRQLGNFFRGRNQSLKVLLEIGISGGRTGVRNFEQEMEVISELQNFPDALRLVGVEFYEGIIKTHEMARAFAKHVTERAQALAKLGAFEGLNTPVIVSAAGSTWFDIVAEELSSLKLQDSNGNNLPRNIILRPGSYLTHEVGTYGAAKDRVAKNAVLAREMGFMKPMVTALRVWAYVQALPESDLAIVAMGKREIDASFDCEFPIPCLQYRPNSEQPIATQSSWKLTYVMDQHSFMQVTPGDDIQVGDMIAFEMWYPGTTLDKFKNLLLVNENYEVMNVLKTYF